MEKSPVNLSLSETAPSAAGRLESLGVRVKEAEKPAGEKEARQILARASRARLKVFPCGGGTSLAAGRLPESVDLALDMTGMSRVLAFDPRNLNLAVLAGMTLQRINEHLAGQEKGFFLPLDPPLPDRATVGGVYSANASGPLRLRYGTVRDQVLGVRGAGSAGQEVGFGGKTVKNVSGYDLTKLFIGSAGSLCLITSLSFRVYPLPEASSLCDLIFGTLEELEKFLAVLRSSPLVPSAAIVTELAGGPGVSDSAGARFRVLVAFEGHSLAVERQNQEVLRRTEELGGLGQARTDRAAMTRALRMALNPDGPAEDLLALRASVPIARGPKVFASLLRAAREAGRPLKAVLDAGCGMISLQSEGAAGEKAMGLVRTFREQVQSAGGTLAPVLAHRSLLEGWEGRVDPSLHRVVLQPLKEKLDPAGVFPPVL